MLLREPVEGKLIGRSNVARVCYCFAVFAEGATGFRRLRRFAVGASRISVIAWCKGCSLLCFFFQHV